MRHGKKFNKLSRPAEHRRALLDNLASALILHKQITTTSAKARALKPFMDRIISRAQQNTVSARRQVSRNLTDRSVMKELFGVIVPKLAGRTSGFSRIVKSGVRKGDGASLAIVELLFEREVAPKGKKKGEQKGEKKAAARPAKPARKKVAPKGAKDSKSKEAAAPADESGT